MIIGNVELVVSHYSVCVSPLLRLEIFKILSKVINGTLVPFEAFIHNTCVLLCATLTLLFSSIFFFLNYSISAFKMLQMWWSVNLSHIVHQALLFYSKTWGRHHIFIHPRRAMGWLIILLCASHSGNWSTAPSKSSTGLGLTYWVTVLENNCDETLM